MRNSRWRRYEDKMRLAVVEKNNFSNFCKSLHYHHQILKSSNCFSRFSLSMKDSSKSKYQLLSPQIMDGCFCFQFWLFYQHSITFLMTQDNIKLKEKRKREASEQKHTLSWSTTANESKNSAIRRQKQPWPMMRQLVFYLWSSKGRMRRSSSE